MIILKTSSVNVNLSALVIIENGLIFVANSSKGDLSKDFMKIK